MVGRGLTRPRGRTRRGSAFSKVAVQVGLSRESGRNMASRLHSSEEGAVLEGSVKS